MHLVADTTRARSELGMIKQDEIFFQLLQPGQVVPPAAPPPVKAPAK